MNNAISKIFDAINKHDIQQIPEYSLEYLQQYSKEDMLKLVLNDIIKFIDFVQLLNSSYSEIETQGNSPKGKLAFDEFKGIFANFQERLEQFYFMGKFLKIIQTETAEIQSELDSQVKTLKEKIEKYEKYIQLTGPSAPLVPPPKEKGSKKPTLEEGKWIRLPNDVNAIMERKPDESIIVKSQELFGLERDIFLSILLICNLHSVYCIPIKKTGSDDIDWDNVVQIGAINTPSAHKGIFKYLIENFDHFKNLALKRGRSAQDFREAYIQVNQALFKLFEKGILFCYIVNYITEGTKRRYQKKCVLLTPECVTHLKNRDKELRIPSLNFLTTPKFQSNWDTLTQIFNHVTAENQKKIILRGNEEDD